MFADASSLRRASALPLLALTAALLFSLAGCGEDEVVDPYLGASINAVMEGEVQSPGFLFKVAPPTLRYAENNVGIVAEGNRLFFLVGPDVRNNYDTWASDSLFVEKRFSHRVETPHLFMRGYGSGMTMTAVDSVESYVLPATFQASKNQIETPGAPLPEISYKRLSSIQEFYPENEGDALMEVQSIVTNFVNRPAHDLPEELAGNPGPENYAWYAVFPESTFRLVDVGPGADYMLKMLKTENLPLVGSFSISSIVTDRRDRYRETEGLGHIVGEMKINWFKFGNTFVRGED